jgi:hypothetical protein
MSNDNNTAIVASTPHSNGDLLFDPDRFSHAYRVARVFKASGMVPQHLTEEACFVGVTMAEQMGLSPIIVLQNIYFVHGTPGWSSKFLIGLANRSGTFKGPLQWDVDKSDARNLRVTCWAVHATTGDRVEYTVDMSMAQAEGWTKNPKYKSMPELMLRYRAAAFLVRLYAPEALMGLPATDEVVDMGPVRSEPIKATEARAAAADAMLLPDEPETVDVEPEQGLFLDDDES